MKQSRNEPQDLYATRIESLDETFAVVRLMIFNA